MCLKNMGVVVDVSGVLLVNKFFYFYVLNLGVVSCIDIKEELEWVK